jgi:adenylate kinase
MPELRAGWLPRTVAQAEALDARLAQLGQRLDAVIYLDVPETEILGASPGAHLPELRAIYQLDTMPPAGGHLRQVRHRAIQRADEQPE